MPQTNHRPTLFDNDADERFVAACCLVHEIDQALTTGTVHYRDLTGALLCTLDQVVLAILEDRLMLPAIHPQTCPPVNVPLIGVAQ